jgi:hypothetical protein
VLCVPLVASVPLHAPAALHDIALLEAQVRVAALPAFIVVGDAVKDTVGAGTTRESPPPQAEANRADPAINSQERERTDIPGKVFVIMSRQADACLRALCLLTLAQAWISSRWSSYFFNAAACQ